MWVSKKIQFVFLFVLVLACICFIQSAKAASFTIAIDGSDAIFLAGRTDLTIPPAGVLWPGGLARHPITPEGIQETLPPIITVTGGDIIRALDPASGGISFYNTPPDYTLFGPEGGTPGTTNLDSFGGISGFLSSGLGPLAGVFLDDSIPNGIAPTRLDFTAGGYGT